MGMWNNNYREWWAFWDPDASCDAWANDASWGALSWSGENKGNLAETCRTSSWAQWACPGTCCTYMQTCPELLSQAGACSWTAEWACPNWGYSGWGGVAHPDGGLDNYCCCYDPVTKLDHAPGTESEDKQADKEFHAQLEASKAAAAKLEGSKRTHAQLEADKLEAAVLVDNPKVEAAQRDHMRAQLKAASIKKASIKKASIKPVGVDRRH